MSTVSGLTQAMATYATRLASDPAAAVDPDQQQQQQQYKPKVVAPPVGHGTPIFAATLMNVMLDAQASSGAASNGVAPNASSLVSAQAYSQQSSSLADNLTDSDRQFIAATGTDIPKGGDAGLPTFVKQIAADRMTGRLTGDITPDYWEGLTRLDASINQPVDEAVVSAGTDYLNGVTT